ncbi:hypothetical protein A0H81_11616 [Grifola frondosa]|uniref:Uncharacterized protein n=1 Tax=Grifola frondosa TaxID=5627 RepID=A0A1C7LW26_GRIFR|nr:hypothetical protein A0H81_11616 [Grifola frondosa]
MLNNILSSLAAARSCSLLTCIPHPSPFGYPVFLALPAALHPFAATIAARNPGMCYTAAAAARLFLFRVISPLSPTSPHTSSPCPCLSLSLPNLHSRHSPTPVATVATFQDTPSSHHSPKTPPFPIPYPANAASHPPQGSRCASHQLINLRLSAPYAIDPHYHSQRPYLLSHRLPVFRPPTYLSPAIPILPPIPSWPLPSSFPVICLSRPLLFSLGDQPHAHANPAPATFLSLIPRPPAPSSVLPLHPNPAPRATHPADALLLACSSSDLSPTCSSPTSVPAPHRMVSPLLLSEPRSHILHTGSDLRKFHAATPPAFS